jgi:hypothetical protein
MKEGVPNSAKGPSQVFMSPPDSHFSGVGILGNDFRHMHSVAVWEHYQTLEAKLFFDFEWPWDVKKPKL